MSQSLLPLTLVVCLIADAQDDAIKKELAAIEGEWSMVSSERDGQPLRPRLVRNARRICRGDVTTVLLNGQLFMRAKFAVDPAKQPKTLDYEVTEGRNQGSKQLGIYELDGDMMKICLADPGNERPTDFVTKGKRGYTVGVWKRQK
jgi:uncharacterized protein (TIGR03067 family)